MEVTCIFMSGGLAWWVWGLMSYKEGERVQEKVKIPGKKLWAEWSWAHDFICRPVHQQ